LETTGLNPFKDDIIGVAMLRDGEQPTFVPWDEAIKKEIASLVGPLLFHNAQFDLLFLETHGVKMENEIHDTMIISYLLDPERKGGHGLKSLAETVLGEKEVIRYEDLVGTGTKRKELKDIDWSHLCTYGKQDVAFTHALFNLFRRKISVQSYRLYSKLEIPLVHMLVDMRMRGIDVDVNYLHSLEVSTRGEIATLLKQLRKYAHINFNSSKQLIDLLHKQWKLPVCGVTPKRKPSVDKKALRKLKQYHSFPGILLEYKLHTKLLGTYIKPILREAFTNENTDKTHTLHPNFNQCITATGRLSSSNPINFQNLPKHPISGGGVRGSFVPRSGYTFIEADYSQIEPRIMGSFSKDPALIKIFVSGRDLYIQVVQQIFQCSEEEAKKKRPLGKVMELAEKYGAEGPKIYALALAAGVATTQDEVDFFLREKEKRFPMLYQYKRDIINEVRQRGYSETLLGRRRYFPRIKDTNRYVRWAQEREAFNAVIQGSAADIMKMALVRLNRYEDFNLLLTVHDSVLIEVCNFNECEIHMCRNNIRSEMEGVVKLRVPLVVDTKIMERWGG